MKRSLVLVALFSAVGLAFLAGSAQASILEIQFSGMNMTYNGSNLFDSGASNTLGLGIRAQADPLETMHFLVDGVQVGSVLTSDIAADLYIAGLANIPAGGGLVTTAGNGNAFGVDLLTKASDPAWGLGMQINQLNFAYTGFKIAIFVAGQSTAIGTQSLPYGLAFDPSQPISMALSSANLSNVTTSGGFVTGFQSSGTGNISGTLLPEPVTMVLMAAGGLGVLLRRRR